ncbi:hypothetical protein DFH09DRAFT_1086935 [Mycena vulgaris]|nr:hypothetical protein DFH09DRAFT_1086935 [Mycena vulgaris]
MYQNTRSYTLYAPKENGIESVIAKEEQNQTSLLVGTQTDDPPHLIREALRIDDLKSGRTGARARRSRRRISCETDRAPNYTGRVNASGRTHGGKGQIWTHKRAARREIGIEWRREDGYARGSGIRTVPEGGQSERGGRSERVKGGGRDAYGETAGLIPAGSALRVRERDDFGGETSSIFNRESHRPDIRNTRRGMRAAGSRSMSGGEGRRRCQWHWAEKIHGIEFRAREWEDDSEGGNRAGMREEEGWGGEGRTHLIGKDERTISRPRGDLRRRTYTDWLEDEGRTEWDGNASEAKKDERKEERKKGRHHACKWRGGMKRARQQGRDGIAPQLGGIVPGRGRRVPRGWGCTPEESPAPEHGRGL